MESPNTTPAVVGNKAAPEHEHTHNIHVTPQHTTVGSVTEHMHEAHLTTAAADAAPVVPPQTAPVKMSPPPQTAPVKMQPVKQSPPRAGSKPSTVGKLPPW